MSLIYLDHNATTPLSPRALEVMNQVYTRDWGNAGSVEHRRGMAAADLLSSARASVAQCIGARPDEVVFTSGATEANNMAIMGCARFRATHEGKGRVIVAATEHKCVLEAAKASGLDVSLCPVQANGLVDLNHFEALLGPDVALAAVMLVNNETAVVQDIGALSALCRKADVKLHCDAAQGLGKMPIDIDALGCDFLSLSAHKAYGPMGVGALFIRRRPRARLQPLVHGGGQERGVRSGTVPVPLVVGFAAAAEEAVALMPSEIKRLTSLRDWFEAALSQAFASAVLKNAAPSRVPHTVNVSFEGLAYSTLFNALSDRFAVSSGSACSSTEVEPSYVLTAMGIAPQLAKSTLRIGLGRCTDQAQLAALIDQLAEIA